MRNLPHRSFATHLVRAELPQPRLCGRRGASRNGHRTKTPPRGEPRQGTPRKAGAPREGSAHPTKEAPGSPDPGQRRLAKRLQRLRLDFDATPVPLQGQGRKYIQVMVDCSPAKAIACASRTRSAAFTGRRGQRMDRKKTEEKSYDTLTGPVSSKGRRGLRIEFLCRGNGPQRSLRRRLISSNSSLMASLSKG